jgi:diguanylate cyclase (GGDEF)-like protein
MLGRGPISISVQISRVVIVTATVAVVLTMLVMIVVAAFLARGAAQQRASTIAELLAANADVPLVLRDADRGRQALAALASSDTVVSARLIDETGKVLVTYLHKRHAPLTDSDDWASRIAQASELTVKKKVVNGGDLIGYAEVTIREQNLVNALFAFIASGATVLALMVLVWALISGSIGRRLSMPLTRFSDVTRKIRDTEEFTHRVPVSHVSEVRRLSEDFNAMLDVIQRRTSEVQERNRQLAQLAFYDPLTGAANRVLLLDRITQLIDAHSRDARPFALIGFDLDDFKLLNDQLGHQVGDLFLKSMANRCKSELRPTDTFARLGGDEFIALLPNVGTRDNALVVARKLAEAVHASNHVHSLPISCTASMGIGLYPEDGLATNELMARVDAAMYEAKASGRNQIRYVSDVTPEDQRSQQKTRQNGVHHEI